MSDPVNEKECVACHTRTSGSELSCKNCGVSAFYSVGEATPTTQSSGKNLKRRLTFVEGFLATSGILTLLLLGLTMYSNWWDENYGQGIGHYLNCVGADEDYNGTRESRGCGPGDKIPAGLK